MQLFADYIQPITAWLHHHPYWALVITLVLSCTESLAIIGSIIPGSVAMTAIGILAGSGAMRIDLTLIAATLGAIIGDSLSYMLGYTLSHRISHTWPFRRYPRWIAYGKDYFERHGSKSVFIGRFVGPLRSIVPLVAGILHMSHLRFFISNILSAIGWALLYVLPGILIGIAGSELSRENATSLFLIILCLLGILWLISFSLRWLFVRINQWARIHLHTLWIRLRKQPYLAKLTQYITPPYEIDHYSTVALLLLTLLSISLLALILIISKKTGVGHLDYSTHLLFQSLRTNYFDIFFTLTSQFTSLITLTTLAVITIFITSYYRDWRSLIYWLSLNFSCFVFFLILNFFKIFHLNEIDGTKTTGFLSLLHLNFSTALITTFLFYINTYCHLVFIKTLNILLTLSLLLSGIAFLYFGDAWIINSLIAFLGGFSLATTHWIFYRKQMPRIQCSRIMLSIIFFSLIVASLIAAIINFNNSIQKHQTYFPQYVLNEDLWWNQTRSLLPIYQINRLGRRTNLLNIQYVGSIEHLQEDLTKFGWKKQHYSLFNSILSRVDRSTTDKQPLISQLYLNKKPVLIMSYQPSDGKPLQILRLWRSNYHLQHFRQPIWLGSVQSAALTNRQSLLYVQLALLQYSQHLIILPKKLLNTLPGHIEPMLLLIKEEW